MFLLLAGTPLAGQKGVDRSTWDRVFTDGQASRGRQQYEAHCVSCHGDDLTGREGRSLVGNQFWQSWGEDSLESLFNYMRASMPDGAPGTLPAQAYVDLVAFVLQKNDYPPGADE